MNPVKRVLPVMLVLLMTGCATLKGGMGGNNDAQDIAEYKGLYNGDMQVAHEAGKTEITAEEAVANGDRALSVGDTDQAMFEYVRALEINGGDAETLNKIGAIHAGLGNRMHAMRAYALSLRIDNGNAPAREGIGLLLLHERRYDEASMQFLAALELDPARWRSHNGLGMLADLERDHKAAARHYRRALDTQTALFSGVEKAKLLNNLGYSVYMSGDWDEALQYYYKALDSNPGFDLPWQNIGLIYTRQERYDSALDAYLHVMDKPAAYNNIGYLCMVNNRYDRAEYFFRKAIHLSPTYYVRANENLDKLNRLRAEK